MSRTTPNRSAARVPTDVGGTAARPPELLVVGAMKCGTSALHALLDRHPDVAMAPGKELNFFFGPAATSRADPDEWWHEGQWHRGLAWYAAQFDPAAPVRGESSPGYTDPSHPEVPARVHAVAPQARLVYLVREPFVRAVSQWRHHVRDGTERRPLSVALLDPDSQYVARSRYLERIDGFLQVFRREQLLVVVQERLQADTDGQLRRVLEHVGADPARWVPVGASPPSSTRVDAVPHRLRRRFGEQVGDDTAALREVMGDPVPEWATAPA